MFKGDARRVRVEVLDPAGRLGSQSTNTLPPLDAGLPFDPKGHTFLEAVSQGIGDALAAAHFSKCCHFCFLFLSSIVPQDGTEHLPRLAAGAFYSLIVAHPL